MGLLSILKKIKEKERDMRILMLGLDNAGKTSVVKRLSGHGSLSSISPTLGFNIESLEHLDFKLNIWDVGGQKSLRSYWRNYFETTDGLVWVVDSCDHMRLEDTKVELHKLLQEERLLGATLLVLANKQDVKGALNAQHIKQALELDTLTTHHTRVFGCSAMTGEQLAVAVDWMVRDIAARIFTLD